MNVKKFLSSALIGAFVLCPTAGFAADNVVDVETQIIGDGGTLIDVTVPLKLITTIDARQPYDDAFTSAELAITNNSAAPVSLSAQSLEAKADSTLKVVDSTKFDGKGWDSLGKKDTKENISFAIKESSNTSNTSEWVGNKINPQWFGAEGSQNAFKLGDIAVGDSVYLEMDAKHGMAWSGPQVFNFDMTFRVELAD